jgi:hypothetical protein
MSTRDPSADTKWCILYILHRAMGWRCGERRWNWVAGSALTSGLTREMYTEYKRHHTSSVLHTAYGVCSPAYAVTDAIAPRGSSVVPRRPWLRRLVDLSRRQFNSLRGHSSFRPLAWEPFLPFALDWVVSLGMYSVCLYEIVKDSAWSTALGEVRVNILPPWWRETEAIIFGFSSKSNSTLVSN